MRRSGPARGMGAAPRRTGGPPAGPCPPPPMTRRARAAIALAAATMAAGCGSGGDDASTRPAATPGPSATATAAASARPAATPVRRRRGGLVRGGPVDPPVYVPSPPGDTRRLFVVEQAGTIRV